jgi:D-alanyl-lipoteichoic acid acyltransferase DltB (MBOAT superfamily)
MLFNSYVFICLFLPIVWSLFWILRGINLSLGLLVLTLASLFFYGYWDIRFLPLLVLSIALNYWIGQQLRQKTKAKKLWLTFGILFNLGLLGFFKYMNFFSEIVDTVTGFPLLSFQILLPIGISFFTFQQITYLVDVFRGHAPKYNILHYALFVSFFPQLIAGPIVHHSEMIPQFKNVHRPEMSDVAIGLSIFIAGLFKKLVLADNIAPFASAVFAAADSGQSVSFIEAWAGLLAFTFQLYFDFSGYCDMAIGLGLMFGIRLPLNFNSPYKAKNVTEFWRRWHITLGRFLREYVYFPIGGSRGNDLFILRNLFIIMLVSGVWHGAGWGFLIWGALHGFLLCINSLGERFQSVIGMAENRTILPSFVAQAMMFFSVSVCWLFFRATTFEGMGTMFGSIFGWHGLTIPLTFEASLGPVAETLKQLGFVFEGRNHVGLGDWATTGAPLIVASFFLVWMAPNTNQIFLSQAGGYNISPQPKIVWSPTILCFCIVAIMFVFSLIFASSISEFLYFQF